MMTSSQIRQSFLDFFKSKQHSIVPSSSLLPDSPNLLFTNAGMNQFVPIFLGQKKPDVATWAGVTPRLNTRAADTQKCIRAGGKHNDLEDVGLDTYHHTFFEMLGNWSFGDYFKKEAIEWAWELVVQAWHFPPQRLYTTVFCPYLGQPGWEQKWKTELEQVIVLAMTSPEFIAPDPNASPFEISDLEAAMYWAKKFSTVGLDPKTHIVPGNKKDNFWMMGDTGPCGPCSELHVDLTPDGNTKGSLVNQGDARCIEIWNLVFIQFNANPDGSFVPLPAKHVDTGMGFERVTSIIQGTKGLTDFKKAKISNYETDIFRPLFDAMETIGGKIYGSTLPPADLSTINDRQKCDIAFRVIADHIRTLSFAIADGIQPSNEGRGYVLRRILRRAVRYGRAFSLREPFLHKLVDVLADTMGDVFPEIRAKKKHVQDVIRAEEEAFNRTLDTGLSRFCSMLVEQVASALGVATKGLRSIEIRYQNSEWSNEVKDAPVIRVDLERDFFSILREHGVNKLSFSGNAAFELYDTYGFPLDLTELMAREHGLTVDKEGFEKLMEEQRNRARAAQKKEVISVSQVETTVPTKFVGFDSLTTPAKVLQVVPHKDKTAVILDTSACYAEMGGQVGDTGDIIPASVAADVSRLTPSDGADSRPLLRITNTQKSGNTWLHFVTGESLPAVGDEVVLRVDRPRRDAIQRHHTVTHLLHWALHEVVSKEASQKGSFVGPDKLTFDFNSAPLTPAQVADIEKLVNERILENAGVSWTEVPYSDVKTRKDVMQFFGDKYGDTVRVVQIGGHAAQLDGYSMELCGGTHTRATGEIGLFRIVGENAIAAGVRRIEAVAGLEAYRKAADEVALIKSLAGKVNSPVHELEKKIESLLAHQKELDGRLKAAQEREAIEKARQLVAEWNALPRDTSLQPFQDSLGGIPAIVQEIESASSDLLQALADAVKQTGFKGVVVLGSRSSDSVQLVATVSPEFTRRIQAGKIIQGIAPIVGGKGGGRPESARGGGKNVTKLQDALARARSMLRGDGF